MPDYSNGKIYKIVDNTNGNVYFGSTTKKYLSSRLAEHKGKFKMFLNQKHHFVTSFKIIENGDYDIILLENYPCETKDKLYTRERHYIETFECINKSIPNRTKKQYYIDHKEIIQEYKKKYRKYNKEKVQQADKQYYLNNKEKLQKKYNCNCGGNYTHESKSKHLKTAKHQNYIRLITLKDCLIKNLSFEETKNIMNAI